MSNPRKLIQASLVVTTMALSATALGDRVGGPMTVGEMAYPRGYNVHAIAFHGQRRAELGVRGQGTSDLDCFLIDPQGHEIARDTRSGDVCYFSWTPEYQGTFTLEVKNKGDAYDVYTVSTN